ncbi:MAG: hypothetical protein LBD10_00805 [Desulfobulbus sp.]|jgi:hypothetical protein|uniref:hypothetical protein n=1 Tax=Desulfobulbus sp. TaxID=895 RepID=UPI002841954C|nr:hypothetical protein [Desulfobulbus sp.]MDR2548739.1 hypothetical protein [Desulfobulbus sp.]
MNDSFSLEQTQSFSHPEAIILSSFPQDRLTRGVQISTGLDRLKFGFYVEFQNEILFDLLGQAKARAQETRQVVPIQLGPEFDQYYNCHATGKNGGYAFHISRADVNVFISTRKDYMDTPNVWVDIGSVSCWAPGYNTVVAQIGNLIRMHGGTIHKNSVSEVHLCADSIGQDIRELGLERYDHWITRANKFFSYYDHSRQKFSGITWNQSEGDLGNLSAYTGVVTETGISVGQGDIMLRVYDKVLEIEKNDAKQSLFASVWHRDDLEGVQVTRTEFQLRKTVLKQFRIKTLQDLYEKLSALWTYCVTDWARLCTEPFDRSNRHQDRAKIHPWWQRLQELQWIGDESASRRKCMPTKNKRQLEDMLVGVALNLAAIHGYTGNSHDRISIWCQEAIASALDTKAKKIDKDTGKSELQARMEQKVNEVWPYGFGEVHGPNAIDAERGYPGAPLGG